MTHRYACPTFCLIVHGGDETFPQDGFFWDPVTVAAICARWTVRPRGKGRYESGITLAAPTDRARDKSGEYRHEQRKDN
jgi:hypothetical protein